MHAASSSGKSPPASADEDAIRGREGRGGAVGGWGEETLLKKASHFPFPFLSQDF